MSEVIDTMETFDQTAEELVALIAYEEGEKKEFTRLMNQSKKRITQYKARLFKKTQIGKRYRAADSRGETVQYSIRRVAKITRGPDVLDEKQIAALEDLEIYCKAAPHPKTLEAKIRALVPDIDTMEPEAIRQAVGDTVYSALKVELTPALVQEDVTVE